MVAASTVEQLEPGFHLEPVGSLQLKGKSQAVDVFALIGDPVARSEEIPRAASMVASGGAG
jgi:class 3 adenylate cyclase